MSRLLFTALEKAKMGGYCEGALCSPTPGEVDAGKRASCPVCGQSVSITRRGRFAHHRSLASKQASPQADGYLSWQRMKARCLNRRSHNYARYGGRGITVCERWRSSFAAFIADVGPRPSPQHSLDRIDNDGNYEPGNCRWALPHEQSFNSRNTTTRVVLNGKPETLTRVVFLLGLKHDTVVRRVKRGISLVWALYA